MEFGFIENIENVDWSIPADPGVTTAFLRRLSLQDARSTVPGRSGSGTQLRIHFGAPAWGHKEWIGKIYPPGAKASAFLFHYSRAYGCIELNTSHYRIPNKDQTEKWLAQVPADFLFCPKVAQSISHSLQGMKDATLLKEWFQFLENMSSHLGTCFIQFPPHFDYSCRQDLFQFLKSWPQEFRLSLEFRHPSWFQDDQILPALTEYLQSRAMGLVITDVAGRRDVVHSSISAPWVFLRFIANNLHPSDRLRGDKWAERLKSWADQGLREIYFIVHEPDDVSAPEMTRILRDQFNLRLGTALQFPRLSSAELENASVPRPPQASFLLE